MTRTPKTLAFTSRAVSILDRAQSRFYVAKYRYDGKRNRVKFLTNTSIWGVDSYAPIAIRWVLVVDPSGEMDPLPLMSTDVNLSAVKIIELYIDRWGLEVTFQEVREHL